MPDVITEPLDGPTEFPPAEPTPMDMTWEQFIGLIHEPLLQRLMALTGKDKDGAEDLFNDLLVTMMRACRK